MCIYIYIYMCVCVCVCVCVCNTEARSRKNCCRGKAKRMTCSEWVFLSLGIQHSILMRHIGICGLVGSTIFFHITLQRHDFPEKKKLLHVQYNACFDYLYISLL